MEKIISSEQVSRKLPTVRSKFQGWRMTRKYFRLKKKSEKLARATGVKHFIFNIDGAFMILSIIDLKSLIKTKTFEKGLTLEYIMSRAFYTTQGQFIYNQKKYNGT